MDTRLRFVEARNSRIPESFAQAVAGGLAQVPKQLPCRYFYDEAGSHLFELICDLPEYYLTRTERLILERHSPAIISAAGAITTLVEFGSGSGCKTRILLDAAFSSTNNEKQYVPIDISGEFLYHSARALLTDYPSLHISAIAAEYNDAIALLPEITGPRLFLFMGSNIGNFSPVEAGSFLKLIRDAMTDTDSLLIGMDLYKDADVLEPAYNDASGVTARFNKNILNRINRELSADFNLDQFEHLAPFVESQSRVEMRLISTCRQEVSIGSIGQSITFADGEYIHTENSYKFAFDAVRNLADEAGLAVIDRWTDDRGWFAVCLFRRTRA